MTAQHTHDATVEDHPHGDPRYLYFLFVSLIFMLLVVPLFESGVLGANLMQTGLTAVLITAAVASQHRRVAFMLSLFVVAIAAPLSWSTRFVENDALVIASCLLESAFFIAMATLILVAIVRRHMASFYSIFGVVCSYLLIGLGFAMIYLALLQSNPGAFVGPDDREEQAAVTADATANGADANQAEAKETEAEAKKKKLPKGSVAEVPEPDRNVGELSTLVYYSFVTMSTLGYGDILPHTGLARTVSWMQSVLGQFYLAVLVAWLVTEIPRRRRAEGIDE